MHESHGGAGVPLGGVQRQRHVRAARRVQRGRRLPARQLVHGGDSRLRDAARQRGADAEGRAEYHYVLIDYICRITGGTLCAGDDACRVEWVPRSQLANLLITEGTIGVIEKAFRERRKYR